MKPLVDRGTRRQNLLKGGIGLKGVVFFTVVVLGCPVG